MWIIGTHNGVRGKFSRIDIDDYPAVKAHLDQYWDKIAVRDDQGATPYNLRNCAYWEDFDEHKIIWKIIGSRLAFTIDTSGTMVNNACYIMTGNELHHILGFLNSSPLIWYSEITNKNKTGVGDSQVGAQNIILFPVPHIISDEVKEYVQSLLKNPQDQALYQQLNKHVYNVYGLSHDEIQYLEALNL